MQDGIIIPNDLKISKIIPVGLYKSDDVKSVSN